MSEKPPFAKVIFLGSSGVGKSAVIERLMHDDFKHTCRPTISAGFQTQEVTLLDEKINLQLWDTAGQERFFCLSSMFFRNTDCCVLTYDISNLKTFYEAKEWKRKFIESGFPENIEEFPFVLIGNKHDMRAARKTNKSDAADWARAEGMAYREVSAMTGEGFEGLLEKIAELSWRYAIKRQKLRNIEEGNEAIEITNKEEPTQKKGCCIIW
ncbi:unnamed protein product [Blepharisma stoltei]|uniref:Uncharacterized protein n=1 Tax=Blepharisma stoltei TaxID=1481888 RepID=A0AAU9IS73_9CILI|nr:unnamed protein product [Blepharisma stoltei]